MNEKKYSALTRIIKLINSIGLAGENDIENTWVYEYGVKDDMSYNVSVKLNSELNDGTSYRYRDYQMTIQNRNKMLIIDTKALDNNDSNNHNYETLLSIKYVFPNDSYCITSTKINGWNYDNLVNLTLDKFMENETHEINGIVPTNYKEYLLKTKELDIAIKAFNHTLQSEIKRKSDDIEVAKKTLDSLSENQVKELKRILINK